MACMSETDRFWETAILGNVVKAPRLKDNVHVESPERSDLLGRSGGWCSSRSGNRCRFGDDIGASGHSNSLKTLDAEPSYLIGVRLKTKGVCVILTWHTGLSAVDQR